MQALFVCLLLAGTCVLSSAHHQELCNKRGWVLKLELSCIRRHLSFFTNLMFDLAALRLGCFSRVCAVRRLCNGDLEENMSWYFTRSQIREIHRVASHCDLQSGYYPRPVWPHWPQWPSWLPSPWR
ncbi:antimicrobial peptide microplusin-like [Haemaphysalis longicornis]